MEICKVHERFIHHFYSRFNILTKKLPNAIDNYYHVYFDEEDNKLIVNSGKYSSSSTEVLIKNAIAEMEDFSKYLKELEFLPMVHFKKINFTSVNDDVIYTLNHHNIPPDINIIYTYKEYLNMFDFELIGIKGEYELYNLIPKKYPMTYV